jgi:hypothetical protein
MIFPADLFGRISGSGKTPAEAKEDLRKKVQSAERLELTKDISHNRDSEY